MRRELASQHVPGAWVVVIRHGVVVKRKGYGYANLEWRIPATPDTLMQTGSIGKMFTAAGIMLLVEDGKLKLTDSIAKYFDDSPNWWKPITIRQMLSHIGGIPDYEDGKIHVDLKKEYTEDELVKFVQDQQPDFAPGEKWAYSNTDYMLLGILIHKLTGKFYADFLKERVWGPAGMTDIRSISDSEVTPHRAAGYEWKSGHWVNQEWVSPCFNSTADGTLYATADDFIHWDRALDRFAVVPKATQEEMWTPVRLNNGTATTYGYAWAVGAHNGRAFVGHSGAWQGFRSVYLRFRDGLSVAVFCNCGSAVPGRTAMQIADEYGPGPRSEVRRGR